MHKYDIANLLGHMIQSVTGIYARSTPEALEDAVNRLTQLIKRNSTDAAAFFLRGKAKMNKAGERRLYRTTHN